MHVIDVEIAALTAPTLAETLPAAPPDQLTAKARPRATTTLPPAAGKTGLVTVITLGAVARSVNAGTSAPSAAIVSASPPLHSFVCAVSAS